jgi:release factor glutamine methyltransferase
LGKKRLQLALEPGIIINPNQLKQFEEALERLLQQEPIQYIIGDTEFFGYLFKVNKHVLIPRPETEELVAWIVEDSKLKIENSDFKILDIGTGSGCIPISLAKENPGAKVSSIDISKEAIEVAQLNANLNKVQVDFVQQDILSTQTLMGEYQVIVSNPPYVRELEKAQMQKNVLDFEPSLALYVKDNDPLIFYRKIAELAKNVLAENGALYLEINQYLMDETKQLLQDIGYVNIEMKKDMYGNYRMCKATL